MPAPAPAVRLSSLTKAFGHARGVYRLDLEVEPGQVFGFLGPNGAGKSTTIRLMLGLYRPDSGKAEVLGADSAHGAHGAHGAETRRRLGYLPGEPALHPQLTGRETLDRIARILGHVDPQYRHDLEERLDVELDRPLRTLSKGNRQKVGLVAAFMHQPELLVLDEPTSGLDPLLQHEFALLLEELVAEGRTVFLSSHDLAEVQRLAHRVAIIKDGQIVADDTVDALRAKAPRTVELTFRTAVDPTALAGAPGGELTTHAGRHATFAVTGEIGPFLAAVIPHGLVGIDTHNADLDDLFLDFYSADERTGRAH